MKKMSLSPLKLDKQTIALLDTKQLYAVIGGQNRDDSASGASIGCCTGSSCCSPNGTSVGCSAGGSVCTIYK